MSMNLVWRWRRFSRNMVWTSTISGLFTTILKFRSAKFGSSEAAPAVATTASNRLTRRSGRIIGAFVLVLADQKTMSTIWQITSWPSLVPKNQNLFRLSLTESVTSWYNPYTTRNYQLKHLMPKKTNNNPVAEEKLAEQESEVLAHHGTEPSAEEAATSPDEEAQKSAEVAEMTDTDEVMPAEIAAIHEG